MSNEMLNKEEVERASTLLDMMNDGPKLVDIFINLHHGVFRVVDLNEGPKEEAYIDEDNGVSELETVDVILLHKDFDEGDSYNTNYMKPEDILHLHLPYNHPLLISIVDQIFKMWNGLEELLK